MTAPINFTPSFTKGLILSVQQWENLIGAKVDAQSGQLDSPTLTGTIPGAPTWTGSHTFAGGATIAGGSLSGSFDFTAATVNGGTFSGLTFSGNSLSNSSFTGGTITGTIAGSPAWSGLHTFNSGIAVSGGGSIAGTFTGSPAWSGVHFFNGGASITGGTLTGTIAGTPTWSGLHTFSGGASISGGTLGGTIAGAPTWSGQPTYGSGVSFGAITDSGITSLAKHITLHTAGYGFGVTSNRLNYVVPSGASHALNVGGTDIMVAGSTGATFGSGTMTVSGGTATFSGGNPNVTATTRLQVGDGTSASSTILSGTTASFRGISFQTTGSNRWQFLWSGTESGSNVGSDLILTAFADDGVTANSFVTFRRGLAAMQVGSSTTMNISGRAVPYGLANFSQSYTSTSAPTFVGNSFGYTYYVISGDTCALGTGNTAHGLLHAQNFGGSGMTGNREAARFMLTQTAATGNKAISASSPFYVGLFTGFQMNSGDGGTDLTLSGSYGGGFAFNPQCTLAVGTNVNGIAIAECNVAARLGTSLRTKTGFQFVKTSDDAVKGSLGNDTCIGIFDQAGTAVGWDYAIRVGGTVSAQWPLDQTNGTILGVTSGANYSTTGAMQAGWGVDLLEVTLANFAFTTNGFRVDGSGNTQIGTGVLSAVSTGLQVDAKGAVGTGTPTIASGGTGHPASTTVTIKNRTYGAVYRAGTNGSGNITVISSVIRQPLAITTAGLPSTLTCTTQGATDGTDVVLNVTWDTSRNGLSLNPTGAKIGFNGSAPVTKPTVTGSKASNAALASLITALANYGLITDGST